MDRCIRMLAVLCLLIAACADDSERDRALEDTPLLRVAPSADASATAVDPADASRASLPPGEPCGDGFCSQSGRCEYRKSLPPRCVPKLPSDIDCGNIMCPDGYRCVGGGDTNRLCTPSPDLVHGKTCADAPCGPNTECEDRDDFAYCRPLLPMGLRCDYVRCRGGYVCIDESIGPRCIAPPVQNAGSAAD